jgi:hypothetical protein
MFTATHARGGLHAPHRLTSTETRGVRARALQSHPCLIAAPPVYNKPKQWTPGKIPPLLRGFFARAGLVMGVIKRQNLGYNNEATSFSKEVLLLLASVSHLRALRLLLDFSLWAKASNKEKRSSVADRELAFVDLDFRAPRTV